jgi:hypothetical protein
MYFGVASPGDCTYSSAWSYDTLIGVSQDSNSLTIVSFTHDGTDYSTIQDTIVYNKSAP